jgi:hypothetical protein
MALSEFVVPYESKANICFDCDKACGGCSWSRNFEPVPGWTAEKIMLNVGAVKNQKRFLQTYHITACPEYVGGGGKNG